MKIRIDNIAHNVEGEAPFTGVILHSNTNNACWGFDPKELVRDIKKEGNEGIIFSGDWEKHPLDVLKIMELSKAFKLKVMVYTDLTFDQFKFELGVASWEKVNKSTLDREQLDPNDAIILFIGATMLDYYLGYQDYYIFAKDGEISRMYEIKYVEEEVEDGKEQ